MADPDYVNDARVAALAADLCKNALDNPYTGAVVLRAGIILQANLAIRQDDPAAALKELLQEQDHNLRSAFQVLMEGSCHGRA